MNMFARFDENPAMTLQDIKETKRYGRTHGRTHGRTDNVETVYPPQTKFAGGIKKVNAILNFIFINYYELTTPWNMEDSVDPDRLASDLDLHCFQLSFLCALSVVWDK